MTSSLTQALTSIRNSKLFVLASVVFIRRKHGGLRAKEEEEDVARQTISITPTGATYY